VGPPYVFIHLAHSFLTSTLHARTLLTSTAHARTVLTSTLHALTLLTSIAHARTLLTSTAHARTVLTSTLHARTHNIFQKRTISFSRSTHSSRWRESILENFVCTKSRFQLLCLLPLPGQDTVKLVACQEISLPKYSA